MGIKSAISAGLQAVAEVFGYFRHRSELRNAGRVQAAKEAANEQAARDRTRVALQKGDVEEMRREDAE